MTMKRTELEKQRGLKINNRLKTAAVPDRYSQGSNADKQTPNPLIAKLLGQRKPG
ncbi:hypothetical protein N8I74_11260 [Chitiniphilus purpureus]|uniref:Uncharacterized protein n=1 Tax=Chitiniphilus purpureus TaxID=2981137 RepID=A0ABY6DHS5_9NEIS|nr:hypothetical protein [Chitiniphilus sp. CD1]UXY13900.1 hypothetical protein N8I74_11260 [Chitiniphilus sp. CD1]